MKKLLEKDIFRALAFTVSLNAAASLLKLANYFELVSDFWTLVILWGLLLICFPMYVTVQGDADDPLSYSLVSLIAFFVGTVLLFFMFTLFPPKSFLGNLIFYFVDVSLLIGVIVTVSVDSAIHLREQKKKEREKRFKERK